VYRKRGSSAQNVMARLREVAVALAVVDVAVSVWPCADERALTSAVQVGNAPVVYGAALAGAVPQDDVRSLSTPAR